jgi:hypothetical protein
VSAAPSHDSSGVPGAVTIVSVGEAGGSGEVQLVWDAVPNATGYRVLRSDAVDGSFETVLDIVVITGSATAADDVINVFSERHTYVGPGGSLELPDQSPRFFYVDFLFRPRCFMVVAYDAAGDGPESVVACGAPPGVGAAPTPVPGEPTFTG